MQQIEWFLGIEIESDFIYFTRICIIYGLIHSNFFFNPQIYRRLQFKTQRGIVVALGYKCLFRDLNNHFEYCFVEKTAQ